jgi:hypothetical protein
MTHIRGLNRVKDMAVMIADEQQHPQQLHNGGRCFVFD